MDPNASPTTNTETPPVEEETIEAAIERGIEAATEQPAEAGEPPASQAGAVDKPAEVAKTPEELAAEAKANEGRTPEQIATEAAAKAKADEAAQPDADTEKEISDLGIKHAKTAERFRELTTEVKAAAPVMAAIKDAGIPVEQLPSALKAASDHREWVQMVVDTGASPEQYRTSLDLLALVSKAQQGDQAAANAALQALDPLVAEMAQWAGRDVASKVDPLDAHPDLKDLVAAGDMPRAVALETVRLRRVAENTKQQTTQREQTEAHTQAAQGGINDLIAIDAEFKASDADYARKRPILHGIVQSIRETLPPNQWGAATRKAYAGIVLPPVAAAQSERQEAAVGHVPLRPTGSRANLQPDFDNAADAMDAGIAAASAAR